VRRNSRHRDSVSKPYRYARKYDLTKARYMDPGFQNLIGMLGRQEIGETLEKQEMVSKPYRYARKDGRKTIPGILKRSFKTL